MTDEYYRKINDLLQGYLEEVTFLLDHKRYQLSFLLMSQIIEFLGALIDDKPLRAKEQSKRRFALSLKKLFKGAYNKTNESDFLYHNFRCNMAHLLSVSAHVRLSTEHELNASLHLKTHEGKCVLVAETLLYDIQEATKKMLHKVASGEIKPKKGLWVDHKA